MEKSIFLYSILAAHLDEHRWAGERATYILKHARIAIWIPTFALLLYSGVSASLMDELFFQVSFTVVFLFSVFVLTIGWSSIKDHLTKHTQDQQAKYQIQEELRNLALAKKLGATVSDLTFYDNLSKLFSPYEEKEFRYLFHNLGQQLPDIVPEDQLKLASYFLSPEFRLRDPETDGNPLASYLKLAGQTQTRT